MLPTGSAKTALLPEILGDVNNAGGGGAPTVVLSREECFCVGHVKLEVTTSGHFMAIENTEKKRQRRRKIHTSRKLRRKHVVEHIQALAQNKKMSTF